MTENWLARMGSHCSQKKKFNESWIQTWLQRISTKVTSGCRYLMSWWRPKWDLCSSTTLYLNDWACCKLQMLLWNEWILQAMNKFRLSCNHVAGSLSIDWWITLEEWFFWSCWSLWISYSTAPPRFHQDQRKTHIRQKTRYNGFGTRC